MAEVFQDRDTVFCPLIVFVDNSNPDWFPEIDFVDSPQIWPATPAQEPEK